MALPSESKRPHGITIIVIWFVLEGIFSFYQNSFGIFGGQNLQDLFVDSLLENSLIAYHFGFGIFYFVMAWAFWEAKPWIRLPAIIVLLATTGVTWVLFSFQLTTAFQSILETILMGAVVVYLMKSNVKKYFGNTSTERENQINFEFLKTKSRVNPILQTVITMILCVLSSISLVTWIMMAGESDVLDFNKGFFIERLLVYTLLPLLIFTPFARIGKIIKIIPGVIGASLGSMTFIFVIYPEMLILPVIVSSLSVIFIGYFMHKWSKQWNQKFER